MPDTTEERQDRDHRADRLKERIYVTFTVLSVVLALRVEVASTSPGHAATTLAITVLGTVLAVFLADVVAHVVVHEALPSWQHLRRMVAVSAGAAGALGVPLILVALAALDVLTLAAALDASTFVAIATLLLVGFLAVRRLEIPVVQKLVVLLAEVLLGVVVIALETVVH